MAQTYRLACSAALFALAFAGNARAQVCTSDDDCDEGYECGLGPTASIDCPPGESDCDSTPEPSSGECKPSKMRCKVDSDCVEGLKCELESGDSDCAAPRSVDGGVQVEGCEPQPEPTEGQCVYELVECEKDADCDDGLECAPIGRTSDCSGSAGPACMPGQECPAQPAPEEMCTETTLSYCFPPRTDCESDDDCDDGARCVELPEDAKEDPPPGWVGASALCFPEALALALEGRVKIAGGHSESASDRASNSTSKSESGGGSEPVEDDTDRADSTNSTAGDKVKDPPKNDDCSVGAVGASDRGPAWLLVLGAAALFIRRRVAVLR